MATIGRLAVLIDADNTGLKAGLKTAVSDTDEASGKIIKNVQAIASAFAGYLTVDMFAGMIKGAADAGKQIDQLSRLSATSTTVFQQQAYAAQQFGISNEKLGDIFKDVQDKIGDFMQTGAGPMADFFENIAPKVGVTADQFRKLGGPEALQLYVSSLEKANLSQSEMTFYLEALASDSALLLPLLKNNGKAMKELGDEAQRLGAVLSDETIQANKEFANQLSRLDASLTSLKINIGSAVIPEITRLVNEFNAGTNAAGGFWKALSLAAINPFKTGGENIQSLRDQLRGLQDDRARYVRSSSDTSGIDQAIANTEMKIKYLDSVMRASWKLSGERMGAQNDPRVIGQASPDETAGYRPVSIQPPAAAPAQNSKAADDAIKKAQEVEEFFAKIGEQTRQRELTGLQNFLDGLREREEARMQSGMNEQALAEEAYQTEYERLVEAKEALALTEEEFTERLLQIRMDRDTRIMDADAAMLDREKQVADERVRINQQAEQLILSARSSATDAAINLLSALGGKSKGAAIAAIALGKAVAIADIIRHTAVAQMHAMAQLGPLAGPAAAAKIGLMGKIQAGLVAATGLVQAGSVGGGSSVSISPTGGTGASNGGTGASSGMASSPMMSQTITIQGVNSGDIFSGDAVRTLIDKLIDAQRNGARILLA